MARSPSRSPAKPPCRRSPFTQPSSISPLHRAWLCGPADRFPAPVTAFVDGARNHHSRWGRAGQRDSQRGRADLAEVAIELLLAVRKTFTRGAGTRPWSTVCSSNVVRTGRKGFSRPPGNLLVLRSFGSTVARNVTPAESGPQDRSQLPMTYSKTLTPLEPRTDSPHVRHFSRWPDLQSQIHRGRLKAERRWRRTLQYCTPSRRTTLRSTVRMSVEVEQCGR